MPLTERFTPADTALVLIDHQVGTMQLIRNDDGARARDFTLASRRRRRSWA